MDGFVRQPKPKCISVGDHLAGLTSCRCLAGIIGNCEVQGKLRCSCGHKLGSYHWAGMQCSCGAWVTPAFAVGKARVDVTTNRTLAVGTPQVAEAAGKVQGEAAGKGRGEAKEAEGGEADEAEAKAEGATGKAEEDRRVSGKRRLE